MPSAPPCPFPTVGAACLLCIPSSLQPCICDAFPGTLPKFSCCQSQTQCKRLVFPFKSFPIVAKTPTVLHTHTPDIILDSSSLLALSCCLIIWFLSLSHLMCSCSQELDFDLAMSRQEHIPRDPVAAPHVPLSPAHSSALCSGPASVPLDSGTIASPLPSRTHHRHPAPPRFS